MIETLELHDATLVAVHLSWADGTCIMTLKDSKLSDCTLTFFGVSNLVLPHANPWGPSCFINSACQRSKGKYEIEMQSGDVFTIEANDVRLAPLIRVGKTGFSAYGTTVHCEDELTRLLSEHAPRFVEVRLGPNPEYEQVERAIRAIQKAGANIGLVGNVAID